MKYFTIIILRTVSVQGDIVLATVSFLSEKYQVERQVEPLMSINVSAVIVN
ncbi:hypothetical protein [Shewanella goraebulensis]|uniref:hypothetical protein n=1 Tax=Shewanella goraebulensis TaxID=3050637 RepID=UPI00254C2B57|nr:hypothetical protein [Shewanella goraebulensis]